ncbi:MAG: DNA recombination protein RmuC [Candidatus Melainabacteria bacterium]
MMDVRLLLVVVAALALVVGGVIGYLLALRRAATVRSELLNREKSLQDALHQASAARLVAESRLQATELAREEMGAQMKTQFELLGHQALKQVQTEWAQRTEQEFTARQARLDERVGELLNPLKTWVETTNKQVLEYTTQHRAEASSLKTQIEIIVDQTNRYVSINDKLADALSNSKGRGDWGEMALMTLLEESGLLPGVHYEAQQHMAGLPGQGGLRPDVTIRLPGNRLIFVDAKTLLVNLEHFHQLAEEASADPADVAKQRKKHAAALEKEILSLSAKAYDVSHEGSVDFVVLFVPRESMLRVALEERPELMTLAFQKRVVLASPLVLMPILKVVATAWDQEQISENARTIQRLGQELHRRAALFVERFARVGERIDQLGRQYGEAKTAFTGRQGFVTHLQKFEQLGCRSEKELPALRADGEWVEDEPETLVGSGS